MIKLPSKDQFINQLKYLKQRQNGNGIVDVFFFNMIRLHSQQLLQVNSIYLLKE